MHEGPGGTDLGSGWCTSLLFGCENIYIKSGCCDEVQSLVLLGNYLFIYLFIYLFTDFDCKWGFTRWQCYYSKTQHTK
jgi:hypothetical protein